MLHEMRYVLEVYRARSFTEAARRLYISQPSLSAMVKRAEKRIGSPIFDRGVNPIGLTPVGREYVRAAERVLEVEESFARTLHALDHCLTGSLSLGGTTLFTSYVLPALISRFSALYPGVEIRLHETHTLTLLKELAEGELDLITDNGDFDPDRFGREGFRRERLLLVVPEARPVNRVLAALRLSAEEVRVDRHRAPDCPALELPLVREEPFLLLKEGNDTRTRADRLFTAAGYRPEVRLLLDQQITSYNLAGYGMGAAFISDTLVKSAPPPGEVCFYRLAGAEAEREISLYYRRTRSRTSAVEAFMAMVRTLDGAETAQP